MEPKFATRIRDFLKVSPDRKELVKNVSIRLAKTILMWIFRMIVFHFLGHIFFHSQKPSSFLNPVIYHY